jgi:hypothetical protein
LGNAFTHPKLAVTAVVSERDFATVLDRRLKRIEQMKANASKQRQLSMVRRLILACLIDAIAGFDHYPTGRDLVILGPPLAVKLRERR